MAKFDLSTLAQSKERKESNFAIWQPRPQDGFVLGRIVDIGEDGATVEPFDRKKKPVVARYVLYRVWHLVADLGDVDFVYILGRQLVKIFLRPLHNVWLTCWGSMAAQPPGELLESM